MAHVALPHELVERAHGLLDRRGRIEAVDLVEVDVVELQPLQAGLDPVHDVAARGAARVRARAGLVEDLGRDDHVLARHLEILQRLAGDLLRHAPGVHIGGVDEVDAGVNRLATRRSASACCRPPIWLEMPSVPPKVMVPRQSSETNRPVRPRGWLRMVEVPL